MRNERQPILTIIWQRNKKEENGRMISYKLKKYIQKLSMWKKKGNPFI